MVFPLCVSTDTRTAVRNGLVERLKRTPARKLLRDQTLYVCDERI